MDVTLYILDAKKQVRKVLVDGVTELKHTEQDWTAHAAVPMAAEVKPGEYIGFACVDGVFRLFAVEEAENDDDNALTYITAIDAAVAELSGIVLEELLQKDVTAEKAVETIAKKIKWVLGEVETGAEKKTSRMYYHTVWEGLLELADLYKMRVVPEYLMRDGKIVEKRINLYKNEGVFRGRFFETERDAEGITITYTGRPVTRMYGLGKSISTGDNAENMTFADVVWRESDGDPVNKPKGQTWVEDADAVAAHGEYAAVFLSSETEDSKELLKLTWEELQKAKSWQIKATAKLSDLQATEGGDRKRVRLGDLAAVIPKHGTPVMVRIVGVDRDYIEPDRTKLEMGSEGDDITAQAASLARGAVHTQETLTIYQNKFQHDEALIQLNAEAIQLNAESILAQADAIALIAGDLEEQHSMIVVLEKEIKVVSDQILLGGFVTADGVLEVLENATVQGSLYIENTLNAYTLVGSECSLGNVDIDGYDARWQSSSVLTALPGVIFTTTTYTIKDGDGNNRTIVVPVSATLTGGGEKTLRYVGR